MTVRLQALFEKKNLHTFTHSIHPLDFLLECEENKESKGNSDRTIISGLLVHQSLNVMKTFSLPRKNSMEPTPEPFIKAARLQNETAPEKLLNRYEKRFEKREKKIRKTIRNAFEIFLAPLRRLKKYFTGTFQQILKVFHRPKFAPKKVFFSPRGSAGVATLTL